MKYQRLRPLSPNQFSAASPRPPHLQEPIILKSNHREGRNLNQSSESPHQTAIRGLLQSGSLTPAITRSLICIDLYFNFNQRNLIESYWTICREPGDDKQSMYYCIMYLPSVNEFSLTLCLSWSHLNSNHRHLG